MNPISITNDLNIIETRKYFEGGLSHVFNSGMNITELIPTIQEHYVMNLKDYKKIKKLPDFKFKATKELEKKLAELNLDFKLITIPRIFKKFEDIKIIKEACLYSVFKAEKFIFCTRAFSRVYDKLVFDSIPFPEVFPQIYREFDTGNILYPYLSDEQMDLVYTKSKFLEHIKNFDNHINDFKSIKWALKDPNLRMDNMSPYSMSKCLKMGIKMKYRTHKKDIPIPRSFGYVAEEDGDYLIWTHKDDLMNNS